jgi:hypothetical protein
LINTIYQERIPADLRGRVFGVLVAFHRLGTPVGVLLAGYLIQLSSLTSALVAIAVLSFLMPIMVALAPAIRSMDQRASVVVAPLEGHPKTN